MTEPELETTAEERATWRAGRAWDMSINDAKRLLRDVDRLCKSLGEVTGRIETDAKLIASLYRSREEMRERAAKVAEEHIMAPPDGGSSYTAKIIAKNIRALPLSPPGTDPTIAQTGGDPHTQATSSTRVPPGWDAMEEEIYVLIGNLRNASIAANGPDDKSVSMLQLYAQDAANLLQRLVTR